MDSGVFLDQPIKQQVSEFPTGISNPGWSENWVIFVCEFHQGPGPPQAPSDDGSDGNGSEGDSVTVLLPTQCCVSQLRLSIYSQAQQQTFHPDPLATLDPEKYILLYAKGQEWYEIYDDCQIISTLDIPWLLDVTGHLIAKIVITPQMSLDSEEKSKQQQSLAYLIGYDLDGEAPDRLKEVTFTRRKLTSSRRQELRNRDTKLYTTEPWTTSVPLPNDMQTHLQQTLLVNLHHLNQISFTVKVELTATPHLLLKVFQRVMAEEGVDCDPTDSLVLRITGREEFLSGDFPLRDFLWVRQCLKTNQGLHLSVIPMAQLTEDTVQVVDWPLVDRFTGLSISHEDLCLEGKDLDDIFMMSLWDCNGRFRVKLLGFDIPKLPNKCPQSVYVEASILYGNKALTSVSSIPKAFRDEVLWNEWLEFDVLLRDLPRGVKLGLTINVSDNDSVSATKDVKSPSTVVNKAQDFQQKGQGRVLYFVNLLLIDHRSLLTQGPHTLHMWSYPSQEEEGFTYLADKLSSATNPDIADSMAISIFLDRFKFPVGFPNSTTPSRACLSTPVSGQVTASPRCPSRLMSPSLQTDPPTRRSRSPVMNTDRARLRRFREESVRYTSNLPYFLCNIDWLKHDVVEDVHWLLSQWEPSELELSVALELLSGGFADEMVRRLAVQRLESLNNDEVLKYLLQLVQTLKVEPYHDSFLARYLIRRALKSKRIGHFFFWYVRSEVAGCPYVRQRMAVVLEAYLLGCGQAMLDSFSQQVQAVEALQEVACRVKALYPDKTDLPPTAAITLRELLENCSLPSEFLVPFDPRVKAGKILLDRCKVMASKKKPLWLEFCPMPSPTPVSPVGIIFKQGDDLRKDMLIIQTLRVMDFIWQEKSLDLNLVPYGCIATGHNIGMIEIVREAVTIAAVHRSQGGTTGAFRNDALFDWLETKCPLQEIHYQAVERFVKSCAGYCVATYVLGIGDRHNDNIMITDHGNLFHIDFGHILGSRKHFLGVSRERVPFVLTPDFLYVMGRVKGRTSLYFQRFRDTCTDAYLSLRCHSRLLVTLFSLMLLTGIPGLSAAEDMRYLREALQEERSEADAREHFLQQIAVCEQLGWTVQANWWIHMVAGIK
ncbi:phosphatidylinositol 4,5-bisphosphate 3-kinase catalytic subunit gamma isoform [Lampris incognitus]|uniref:phosphatidylinositol 4,5-bisphosphate 3-kinase catalytic subunit gamma isoform n=1 Tax=Lampris incognitus TaxID=2546036 RepID=UPI0024B489D4|nr:phosphatidylinositol 4,5-bisphosphate 3-kinase catalytic subunit gamma isoform [Lampris incognitus]